MDVLLEEKALEDYAQTSELHVYLKPLDAFGGHQSPRYANPPPSLASSYASTSSLQTPALHSLSSSQTDAITIPQQSTAPFGRISGSPQHLHHRTPSKSDAVRKLIEENRLPPPQIVPSLSTSVSLGNPFSQSPILSPTGTHNNKLPSARHFVGSTGSNGSEIADSPSTAVFGFLPVATHDEMMFTPSPTPHESFDRSTTQSYPTSLPTSTDASAKNGLGNRPNFSSSQMTSSLSSSTSSNETTFTLPPLPFIRHPGSMDSATRAESPPQIHLVTSAENAHRPGANTAQSRFPLALTPIQHQESQHQQPPDSPSRHTSESRAASIRLRKAYDNVTVNEVLTDPRIQLTPTTHKDVTLEWDTPPKTVLIIKKRQEPGLTELLRAMACWLQQEKGITVLIEPSVTTELPEFEAFKPSESDDDTSKYPDIVICLGGDGTVLHANTLFQNSMPPVMAFSLGSLGFLTPFKVRKYKQSISGVLNQCKVTLRSRLFCIVVKHDAAGKECVSRRTVLNEVVVDRGYSPYLSNLECYCDNVPLTNIQADGIIISSTTGSTAYSLSAGGSMVHPQMPAILFTPICPHSLSFRPLIFPDSVELKIQVPHDSRSTAWASFDGREQTELSRGDFLIIRVSKWPFVWIRESDGVGDWFKSLADCLHWNDRRKQKSFGIGVTSPSLSNSTAVLSPTSSSNVQPDLGMGAQHAPSKNSDSPQASPHSPEPHTPTRGQ